MGIDNHSWSVNAYTLLKYLGFPLFQIHQNLETVSIGWLPSLGNLPQSSKTNHLFVDTIEL